jgi:rhodanese-related sulfurtransferase
MNKNKILWALVIALGLFVAVQQLQPVEGVDVKLAQSMNQQGALLLDVREPEEYAAVHAPNAKLIPLGQLNSRLPEIASYKDKPIVVICRSGRRSGIAVAQLREAGYTQVSNIKGGINAWEHDGLQVVKM